MVAQAVGNKQWPEVQALAFFNYSGTCRENMDVSVVAYHHGHSYPQLLLAGSLWRHPEETVRLLAKLLEVPPARL